MKELIEKIQQEADYVKFADNDMDKGAKSAYKNALAMVKEYAASQISKEAVEGLVQKVMIFTYPFEDQETYDRIQGGLTDILTAALQPKVSEGAWYCWSQFDNGKLIEPNAKSHF